MAATRRRLRRSSAGGDVGAGFREAMRHLAATVVMVTCEVDGRPWGLTISSCCSVSVTPPMILISLGAHTATANAIREQQRFGVSILGQRGRDAAVAGAVQGQPKFVDTYCVPHEGDDDLRAAPVVRGALAHLDCRAVEQTTVADHVVFFGAVEDVILFKGERPLIYYARDYTAIADADPWWC
ncbi:4-nitrophenol 4-monooxygenase/4-nitrocatechol 2-monooxygenase, reductase component [Baekduia alba]|uniref:flavin reductase family protein n=1 Tax=Baekduia alba TaxID=2997333 RepID=UPI0023408A46|nr:flavin reductase family protein [Baekduia alba]WCB92263.1 4-nitrophenol 4-monooxygenase/4-nitrocatechol 2-monooxygenase, reductase component [Baekduia alba]